MGRIVLRSLAFAATALVPLGIAAPAAHAQSTTQPRQQLEVAIGRGTLVNIPGKLADIFIANDGIADVQVKSPSQVFIFGKKAGETTIYASNAAGAVIWSSVVRVGSNIDSLDQMLKMAMPEADVTITTMNGTVLLTGTVAAPEDASEAQRLVQGFSGEGINVISRLKVATPLQVNLQVKFAEVSRTLVREIGVNLASVDGTGGFKFGIGQGEFYKQFNPGGTLGIATSGASGTTVVPAPTLATRLVGAGKLLGLDLLGALDLGEQVGLVSTITAPNLTALSGETAEFLAGGEYPIPVSNGLGSTSIQFKPYGVSLTYTPTVLANGRISIRVKPEVSEISTQGAIVVDGLAVPSLNVRRADTTIELGSGQSFMIAGLMSNNASDTIKKLPGAGDIPILGNLFRSTNFRKGETELVIVVTPYLVKPVDAKDIKLPTDGFRAATIGQQLLGNQIEDGSSGASRNGPRGAPSEANPQVGLGPSQPVAPAAPAKGKKTAMSETKPGFDLN